jgi:hypothetical protein
MRNCDRINYIRLIIYIPVEQGIEARMVTKLQLCKYF